ncbi:TRAM domain-containing protein [Salinarchaeum sp. IM2453]|uniref:DUF7513 family protein n=1 Tax=Salinarchaeum sp. IM2453 TaxID=2862870 RepID=UPI001C82D72E|nr:TRAM domain-containing protein [Salinarchaeum sp. IM2453]QZA88858.1 TRAM domain-containing protein [Salinarchaeum sp. IM2453]
MSFFKKYLKGWKFRTGRPTLDVDSTVDVFVSEHDGQRGLARIGDTQLYVNDLPKKHKGKQVRVRVTSFDSDRSVGEGEFVKVVGESSYSG